MLRGKTWDAYLYGPHDLHLLPMLFHRSPQLITTSPHETERGWKGWQNLVNEREIGDQWLDEADGRR